MIRLLPIDAETYEPSGIRSGDRVWTETNCYVDLWIELLHSRGLEPRASLAFTLGLDFEGDQFTFFKFPHRDLRALYGIDVQELNIWRGLVMHAVEQCGYGRVLMPEVDSFYLPDTAGVSYRNDHAKTTIGIVSIDPERHTLRYFHGRGLYELSGNDFAGVFRLGEHAAYAGVLPPYTEIAKMDAVQRLDTPALVDRALALTRLHLATAPSVNPIAQYAARLVDDLAWLRDASLGSFHQYAFATVRQAGACFGLTTAFLQWLDGNGATGLRDAAVAFDRVSVAAKAVELKLARMVRLEREADVTADVTEMVTAWDEGMSRLTDRFAR